MIAIRCRALCDYKNVVQPRRYLSVLPRIYGRSRLEELVHTVLFNKDLNPCEKDLNLLTEYLAKLNADFLERAFLPYAVICVAVDLAARNVSYSKFCKMNFEQKIAFARKIKNCENLLNNDKIFTKEYYILAKNSANIQNNDEFLTTQSRQLLSRISFCPLPKYSAPRLDNDHTLGGLLGKNIWLSVREDACFEVLFFGNKLLGAPPAPYKDEWAICKGVSYNFAHKSGQTHACAFDAKVAQKSVQNHGNFLSVQYVSNAKCTIKSARVLPRQSAIISCEGGELFLDLSGTSVVLRLNGATWGKAEIEQGVCTVLRTSFVLDGAATLCISRAGAELCTGVDPVLVGEISPLAKLSPVACASQPAELCATSFGCSHYTNLNTFHAFTPALPVLLGTDKALTTLDCTDCTLNVQSTAGKNWLIASTERRRVFGSDSIAEITRITSNSAVGVNVDGFRAKRGRLTCEDTSLVVLNARRAVLCGDTLWLVPRTTATLIRQRSGAQTDGRIYPVPPCPFSVHGDQSFMDKLHLAWQDAFGIGTPTIFESACLARLIAYFDKGRAAKFASRLISGGFLSGTKERLVALSLAFWSDFAFNTDCAESCIEQVHNLVQSTDFDQGEAVLAVYCIHKALGLLGAEDERLTLVRDMEKVLDASPYDYGDVMDFQNTWLERFFSLTPSVVTPCIVSALSVLAMVEDTLGISISKGRLKIGDTRLVSGEVEVRYTGNGTDISVNYKECESEGFIVDGISRTCREVPLGRKTHKILVHYRPDNYK